MDSMQWIVKCSKIKSGSLSQWVSESVSQWQGHLLSCQVTAKHPKKLYMTRSNLHVFEQLIQIQWKTVKIELLSQLKLEAEFCNIPKSNIFLGLHLDFLQRELDFFLRELDFFLRELDFFLLQKDLELVLLWPSKVHLWSKKVLLARKKVLLWPKNSYLKKVLLRSKKKSSSSAKKPYSDRSDIQQRWEDFVYFHLGFTALGNLLRTRSSLVWKAYSLPQAELTQHLLKVLHWRRNSGNLWLVCITNQVWTWCCTWARRRRRKRRAGRPCCHRCTTPAAFLVFGGWVDGEEQHHGEAEDGKGHDGQGDTKDQAPEGFALKAKIRKSVVSLHHKSSVDLMLHVELGDLAATNVQHLQHF